VSEQPQWTKGPGYGGGPYGGQPGYGGLSPSDERTWSLIAHLSGLVAAFFFVGFLGPLIVMLVQGPKSAFVRRHAVEALNFWILLFGLSVLGIAFGVLTLGFGFFLVIPLGVIIVLAAVVFSVLGAIAANSGQEYRYPVNLRLVK
jgi:uncharacterized Tic20 family protein